LIEKITFVCRVVWSKNADRSDRVGAESAHVSWDKAFRSTGPSEQLSALCSGSAVMNRGVFIVAVALGGFLGELHGQDTVWRPAQRPVPPATVRGVSGEQSSPPATVRGVSSEQATPLAIARGVSSEQAGAALGRPMTPTPEAGVGSGQFPRPFPPAYRTALPLAPGPESPGIEPLATVPQPGEVIAASHSRPVPLPAPTTSDPEETAPGDMFAADRNPPSLPLLTAPAGPAPAAPPLPLPPAPEPVRPGNWVGTYPTVPPQGPPPGEVPFMPPTDKPRFYLDAQYLLWWIRRDRAPVLVTTGDAQGGANTNVGALGQADTVVINDGTHLTKEPRSGARFYGGYFLDCEDTKAIELGGFFLPTATSRFNLSSAQTGGVITRPFFNLNQNIEFTEQTAFPTISRGSISIRSPSDLYGLEANMLCKLCCGCDYRLDLIGGFRFLSLKESLTIMEDVQHVTGLPNPLNGTRAQVLDSFATRNEFYGGQIGVAGGWRFGKFSIDGRATLAMGDTHQTLVINGSQTFPPGTPNVSPLPGGLLALNSNIGTFTRDRFSVAPELRVGLGYNLTDCVRVSIGYDFLYWSNVIRPGEQIDRGLDITRIPNIVGLPASILPLSTPRPAVLFKESDFWAQGLVFGLEIFF
jgi:hypothetical protein